MYRPGLLALAFVLGVSVGCGDTASPSNDAAGTYDLVSVNGVTIPGTVNLGGLFDVTVNSGALRLDESG